MPEELFKKRWRAVQLLDSNNDRSLVPKTFLRVWLGLAVVSLSLLQALEVTVNTGREDKADFSVLNLRHDDPFKCSEIKDHFGVIQEIVCHFDKRPSDRFTRSENIFFKLTSDTQGDTFNVHVFPKKKAKLFPIQYDMSDSQTAIWEERPKMSKHWQIVGFEENLPFLEQKVHQGINFPAGITPYPLPRVGALDIAKRPLQFEEGEDVPQYLAIKQQMEKGEFQQAIYAIDALLSEFPETVFKKDLILFKLRALDGMKSDDYWEEIVDLGKSWVKQYPADEAATEVLLYLAKTYNKMGLQDESEHYFERIFYEHAGEKYEKLAKIAYADIRFEKGDDTGAMKLYQEALVETDDRDVASKAALAMANRFIEQKRYKLAESYYRKVFDANRDYFLQDKKETYGMAKKMAEHEQYFMAADLAQAVLPMYDKNDRDMDEVVYNIGHWLDEAGDMDGAYQFYSKYLNDFPLNPEVDEVKERLDKLLFYRDDANTTKKLQHYDYLIENYQDDEIAQKAKLKKAEALFDEGNYTGVIEMKPEFPQAEDSNASEIDETMKAWKGLADSSLSILAENALKEKRCKDVMAYWINDGAKFNPLLDEERYACAYRLAFYDKALDISFKHLDETELDKRIPWLYRHEQALMRLERYREVVRAAEDIRKLAEIDKGAVYDAILYDLFVAYEKLGEHEKMLKMAQEIAKTFPDAARNIEPYTVIVKRALEQKDDFLLENYAEKIRQIQRQYKLDIASPWIDFVWLQLKVRQGENAAALATAIEVAGQKGLSGGDLSNALYWQGYLHQQLKDQESAKKVYERCGAMEEKTPWVKLCQDALKLMN